MPAILLRASTVSISSVITSMERRGKNIFSDEERWGKPLRSLSSHSIWQSTMWHDILVFLFYLHWNWWGQRSKKKIQCPVWANTRKHRGFVKTEHTSGPLKFQFPWAPSCSSEPKSTLQMFCVSAFIYTMSYRFALLLQVNFHYFHLSAQSLRGDVLYTCNLEIIYVFHHSYVT